MSFDNFFSVKFKKKKMLISLFISFASCARFTRKKEKQANYTQLSKTQVNTWIAKNPNCVIVYSDSYKTMKPLKQAIDDNSNFVSFALADPNPEDNDYCIAYPCASAYLNGRHIRTTVSDLSPIDFQFWVTHTLSEPHFDIVHPEELRRLVKLPGNHILAVDVDKRPRWVPKDQVLFHVTEKQMEKLNMIVHRGIYLFRSVDRELIEMNSWDTSLFSTALFEIGVSKLRTKEYLAMSLIDHYSDETDKMKFDAMRQFANEFGSKVHFTAVADSSAGHMAQACKFTNICGPLFLVVKTSNITGEHWGITEPTYETNVTLLRGFLQNVLNGKEEPLISEVIFNEKDEFGITHISAKSYESKVHSQETHSLVIIISSCTGISTDVLGIAKFGSHYYQDKGVKFYMFDEGHNDNLQGVVPFEKLPLFKLYKKGSTEPVEFTKELTLPNLEKFILQNTGVALSDIEKKQYQDEFLAFVNTENDFQYVDYDARIDL